MTTWLQRIAKAKQTGHFTRDDKSLALHWPTCSVGEAVARNRKAFTYETADLLSYRWRTLEDEGMRFCGFVRRDHPDEAEDLHRAIAQHVKRLAASRVTALKRKKVTP